MSSTLFAALTLASLGAAHADGLRPIEANTNDLGEVSGVTAGGLEGTRRSAPALAGNPNVEDEMTAIEQTARGVRLALRDGELLNGKLDRTDFANQVAALGSVEGVAQPAAGKSPEVALALLQLRSRGGLPPRVLRRLREYVEAHLEENISLQMLASTAGLSMSYFARAFKQSEGVPPHEYLVRCRVRRAQELLATTDLPLSEIARIAGFSDQSHCTRRFRERVGITPSSYRRSMR